VGVGGKNCVVELSYQWHRSTESGKVSSQVVGQVGEGRDSLTELPGPEEWAPVYEAANISVRPQGD